MGQVFGAMTIAEKPVGADALKRVRKNMQQEAPQVLEKPGRFAKSRDVVVPRTSKGVL